MKQTPCNHKWLRRILSGALCLLTAAGLCLFPGIGMAETAPETGSAIKRGEPVTGSSFVSVAAGERLTLSCNPSTGFLAVEDRLTGRVYTSNPENYRDDDLAKGVSRSNLISQLLLTVADAKGNLESYNTSVDSVGENGLTVCRIEGGCLLEYRFPKLGLTIPVAVTLRDDTFRAEILYSEIEESDPNCRLLTIGLLPFFGAAYLDEEGYILLPDGSGALMRFNNGKTTSGTYSKPVYGNDDYVSGQFRTNTGETLSMPLFGMHYEAKGETKEAGFVATAVSGAAEATLNASPSGIKSGYNSAYFSFVYRSYAEASILSRTWSETTFTMIAQKTVSFDSACVEYGFLDTEAAGYTEMAAHVQKRLIEQGMSLREQDGIPVVLDIYNSVVKLGYTLGIPHKKSFNVTSFQQTGDILNAFSASGTEVQLLGWDKDGAGGGSVRYRYRPASVSGGGKALKELLGRSADLNARIYLDTELSRFTVGTMRYNTLFSGANQITNKARKVYSYKLSTNEQDAEGPVASLLTPTLLSDAFSRLQKALPEAITGLSMTSLSNAPYADYRGTYTDRQQTAETMASVLESAGKTRGVYAENPAYYALPYLQVAAGLPSDSSRYDVFDESVPFFQLTLRGLMTVSTRPLNLAGDGERLFLKAVETGSSLKFAFIGCDFSELRDTALEGLYGASFELWKDSALTYQQRLEEALEGLENARILSHRTLDGGRVAQAVYDTGDTILVNYGDTAYEADGVTVDARTYVRISKGGEAA